MRWHRAEDSGMLPTFVQCAGCSYNFLTGDGSRSCGWYECPYLPEEYKVFCPNCNFNFATGEGNPWCSDQQACVWSVEGRKHARLARARFDPTA